MEFMQSFARRSLLWVAPLVLTVPLRSLSGSPVSLGQPRSCVSAQLIDGVLRCDHERSERGTVEDELRALCPEAAEFTLEPGDAVRGCALGRMSPADLAALAQPVDLNAAAPEELGSLPGIGPALSARIIEGRPYAAVDELDRVKGIGPKRLDDIRPRATVVEQGTR